MNSHTMCVDGDTYIHGVYFAQRSSQAPRVCTSVHYKEAHQEPDLILDPSLLDRLNSVQHNGAEDVVKEMLQVVCDIRHPEEYW